MNNMPEVTHHFAFSLLFLAPISSLPRAAPDHCTSSPRSKTHIGRQRHRLSRDYFMRATQYTGFTADSRSLLCLHAGAPPLDTRNLTTQARS